ncbi:hypothetical protein EVJ58_g8508 [Rhodofomes roseus]|uniref:Uncharacterized protein n=1 Tax=Rhodofomes roseus TaxID=34475 RepID=A0A4Y9Y2C0_9APHY|nr:hypothetical protein EVJ58_g8508 [Rhodofomes roseus]
MPGLRATLVQLLDKLRIRAVLGVEEKHTCVRADSARSLSHYPVDSKLNSKYWAR